MISGAELVDPSSTEGDSSSLGAYLKVQKEMGDVKERIEKLEEKDLEKSMISLIKSLKFISWFFPILAILMLVGYLFIFDKTTYNQLLVGATVIMLLVNILGSFIKRKE
jgi:hypothetical protein